MSGKEIKITGPSFKCLNISHLESGFYFLEITLDNNRITRKLVID
ncbi:MAG: T9SS type A sorting domain-containing protein [Bacteroidales bacterium]|nr:T9SS type A sorting domain-containing protein [Bacteroidales bacterium]